MAKLGIALQVFSLRDDLAKDFVGTLRAVSALGYQGVELVSYYGNYGLSSAELKRVLSDLNLKAIGIHIGAATLKEKFDETVGYYADAGLTDIGVSSLPHDDYATAEGCRQGGEWLAQLAERGRAYGVGLYYHNHHSDFNRFGDQFGLDLILAGSTAKTVGLEADVYWITYGGYDPATIIRQYADRCRFIHLKDRPAVVDVTIEDVMAGKAEGGKLFAEVGEGVVDWPAVFAASEASPASWYVVEQDASSRPMLESVAISMRHLKEWGKI